VANAKNVRISLELSEGPSDISGDAVRLQQVVSNLLNNSVKFCEPGGQIKVSTRLDRQQLLLVVEDDGRGIDAAFLPLLFERFRQAGHPSARARGGGLGLGLAIARYLVEAHHGTISATSPGEGQGATFTVSLPLLCAASSTPSPPPEAPPASNRQLAGAYVLVIDDDEDARELLSVLLGRAGAEVALAASAKEARAMIRARHPDVIVCDVSMPEQDGLSFMRVLRASGERAGAFIPALALTGHAGAQDSRAALLAGFQMHASKPLDPPRLLEDLSKLWRRGIARNS
jgi:CheY-like chemotaxis protein